eukprot:1125277-Pyramimonas_sp.AAC.1
MYVRGEYVRGEYVSGEYVRGEYVTPTRSTQSMAGTSPCRPGARHRKRRRTPTIRGRPSLTGRSLRCASKYPSHIYSPLTY